jgi:hypothetical protein
VRRLFLLVGLALSALLAFGACGLSAEGEANSPDGGGGTGAGGTGVGGGTCFPGAKVCPDATGKLVCANSNVPETGCKSSSACKPCTIPHATAACSDNGVCSIDHCDSGWDDCNGDAADGCETNLASTDTHCGSCATDCIASKGANWICNAGACEVNQCCPTGVCTLRNCDGDRGNGCEVDIATDVNNCNGCGTACVLPHATPKCEASACAIDHCDPGWSDCNGQPGDGCEVNTDGDFNNCGGCGKACSTNNGGPACVSAACQIACFAGFANCNGDVGDGCEINVASDPAHCGGCSNACNPQHATGIGCSNGGCTMSGCTPPWADCSGGVSDGCETDTSSDTAHCGSCSTSCSPPAHASASCNGSCGFNCNSGYHACGGACYGNGDPTHCGSGCLNCPGPSGGSGNATCSSGSCTISCSSGTPNLCPGGLCVNFQSDNSHCGGCNAPCTNPPNGSSSCSGGGCVIGCNSGYHKCGNNCYMDDDVAHCGASCKACPGPTSGPGNAVCNSGSCAINCTGGTTLCGTTVCANLQTDASNCSSCGHQCGPGATCTGGTCGGCQQFWEYCDDTLGCKDCCNPGASTGCPPSEKCCSNHSCGC